MPSRAVRKPRVSRGKRYALTAVLLAAAGLLLAFSARELARKPVIIVSEVCSVNRGILTDEDGRHSDFIELYNAGDIGVSLRGWYLSDSDNQPLRWRFPDTPPLMPGEYLYVFASGANKTQADGIHHTSFSISQTGEPVLLSNASGVLVSRAEPFAGVDNTSYAWIEAIGGYAYLAVPTPGAPNTGAYALDPSGLRPDDTRLIISEYMSQNSSVLPDADGAFHDWAEIYNPNDFTVSLAGWSLSDNSGNLEKWTFPGGYAIGPGEYITLWLSGLDEPGHVSFRLGRQDQELLLVDPNGRAADTIPIMDTPLDTSYGRMPDGTEGYFAVPTPGQPNLGPPAPDFASLEWDAPEVYIMEYMSSNDFYIPDEEGDYNDWVELYNPGAEAVNLAGYTLSDREDSLDKWEFPAGSVLAPGERLVIQLSGKKLPGHANFSLGRDDHGVFLSDRYGRCIDKAPLVMPQSHVSYGRDENNYDRWLFFPRPTPGEPNTTEGFESLGGISALSWRGLYIAEVSHKNWVSLGNAADEPIQTAGWHLSDSGGDLRRMALPDRTLEPGQTLRVDTSFGIRGGGETLYLTDGAGALRDSMHTGSLRLGVTSGRAGDSETRVYFLADASGAGDRSQTYSGYAGEVRASHDDGYVPAGTSVALTAPQGGTVRYTLDGTEPTAASPEYTAPIVISGPTPLRARVFREGRLPGHILTRTYLTGERHTLPVIHITTDPKNLFDHNIGIFADGPGWTPTFPHVGANFWKDWERPIHFAYYNEDGTLCVESAAGVKTFGQYSRAEKQKAVAIQFRKDYGANRVAYPFFPGNEVSEYGSLVLRASGQDWNISKLRDAFMATSVKDTMDLDLMDARPAAVYINGEYWGLYNLREKINENYFETRYGVPEDEIDIIKGNSRAIEGSNREYVAFVDSLTTMNTTTDAAYEYIDARMDLTNWMDFWICQTYFVNTDSGNIKFWKQHGEGNKWRWVLFDLDWALFPSTYQHYPIARMIDSTGHGVGRMFSTRIAREILKNKRIRDEFVARYEYHLDHTFQTDRMIGILDSYADLIRPELPAQIERWGGPGSMAGWERNVDRIRNILRERPAAARAELEAIRNYRG
ncbi:MAG: lamin tail domain-containing protein [Oscillospiraceae bacterium]|nr:lamin tail domain-containing protein [Oscillospiraceae bacterium]